MANSASDAKGSFVWRTLKGGVKLAYKGLKIGIAAAGIKTLILDPIADRHKDSKTVLTSLTGTSTPTSASTSASFVDSLQNYAQSNASSGLTTAREGLDFDTTSSSDDFDLT